MKKMPRGKIVTATNSKATVSITKIPMGLVPPSAKIWCALAMLTGKEQYGLYNYRDSEISMMMYLDAIERHHDLMLDGEEKAKDTGVYHAAHLMACGAILIDGYEHGNLLDDRPPKGEASIILERERKLVQKIQEKYRKG